MRKLSQRYMVRAILRLETPLHVGGALPNVRSDLPLAEDGQGNCYIPGTSLAGALRAWAAPEFRPGGAGEECETNRRAADFYPWGPPPQSRNDRSGRGDQASHVVVEDAIPILPEAAQEELRDHVGIARDISAAAPGIKYDRAILPRGTLLPLNMTWEVPLGCEAEASRKLTALLLALKAGAIRFGAARSRGLGRMYLDGEPEIRRQELLSTEGIKALLLARIEGDDKLAGVPALADWRKEELELARLAIDIEIRWHPVGPLMVKSGTDGIAIDMLPLVSADGARVSMVLPGSAIKGALRAQAERILRTVCGVFAPCSNGTAGRFLEQLRQKEIELTRWLFGAPGERKSEQVRNDRAKRGLEPEAGPGLAALWVDDVYLAKPFARKDWEAIAAARELERKQESPALVDLARSLVEQSGIVLDPAMHVAVDRWTGGAADGLLFSVLEPHASTTAWEPIRLTLQLDRLRDQDRLAALGLLLLTLRDVAEGIVPIGFGGNRGLGAIKIEEVTYRGLDALDRSLAAGSFSDDGSLRGLPEELMQSVRSAWRNRFRTRGESEGTADAR